MRYTVEVITDGTSWYKEGTTILHREDGPARENIGENKGWNEWYINGLEYSESAYKEAIKKLTETSCAGKVVEVDGKKYKLVEI